MSNEEINGNELRNTRSQLEGFTGSYCAGRRSGFTFVCLILGVSVSFELYPHSSLAQ